MLQTQLSISDGRRPLEADGLPFASLRGQHDRMKALIVVSALSNRWNARIEHPPGQRVVVGAVGEPAGRSSWLVSQRQAVQLGDQRRRCGGHQPPKPLVKLCLRLLHRMVFWSSHSKRSSAWPSSLLAATNPRCARQTFSGTHENDKRTALLRARTCFPFG